MRKQQLERFDSMVDELGALEVCGRIVAEMTIPQMEKLQQFLCSNSGNIDDDNAIFLAVNQLGISQAFAIALLQQVKPSEPDPKYWYGAMQRLKESGVQLGSDLEGQIYDIASADGLKKWARYQPTSRLKSLTAVPVSATAAPVAVDEESRREGIQWYSRLYRVPEAEAEALAGRVRWTGATSAAAWFNEIVRARAVG